MKMKNAKRPFLSPDGWIDLETGEEIEIEEENPRKGMKNPFLSPDGWIDLDD